MAQYGDQINFVPFIVETGGRINAAGLKFFDTVSGALEGDTAKVRAARRAALYGRVGQAAGLHVGTDRRGDPRARSRGGHFLQFKGQKVDAHNTADLLRCIDAVAGDGASFDSLRRFVHIPTTDGVDDAAAVIDVAGFACSSCCPPQRGPCSRTSSVSVVRGWRATAPTLL